MEAPQNSVFFNANALDEIRAQQTDEFDVRRESTIFAEALVRNNQSVSAYFEQLCVPLKTWTGGHFAIFPPETLLWKKAMHREHLVEGVSLGIKWTFYVVWPLKHGSSDGHGTNQRVIAQVDAEQFTTLEKHSSGLKIKGDHLHLKFRGFCAAALTSLADSPASTEFDNLYPNIPSRLPPSCP